MTLQDIKNMPTTIDMDTLAVHKGNGSRGIHESLFRSFHVLEKVKHLLINNTKPEIIVEIIEHLEEKQ